MLIILTDVEAGHNVRGELIDMRNLVRGYMVDLNGRQDRRGRQVEILADGRPLNLWRKRTFVFQRMKLVFENSSAAV